MENVTFLQAWKDFFKNLFNFSGKTTKKGYWSVVLILGFISTILISIVMVQFLVFIIKIYNGGGEEIVNKLFLIAGDRPATLFGDLNTLKNIGFSDVQIETFKGISSSFLIVSITGFVFTLLTFALSIRRFRDVGFGQGFINVVIAIKLYMLFFAVPGLLGLVIVITLGIVIPCIDSNKYFATDQDGPFKQFLFRKVD